MALIVGDGAMSGSRGNGVRTSPSSNIACKITTSSAITIQRRRR